MDKQVFSNAGRELKKEFMNPVQNHLPKPRGGLWTSTFNPEIGSDWIRWCEEDGFISTENRIWTGYLLTPSKEVKIYTIDSYEDMMRFIEAYCHVPHYMMEGYKKAPDLFANGTMMEIDVERFSEKYDALHLTKKGFLDCQDKCWESKSSPIHLFSGWDCESTFWVRWMFDEVEPFEFVWKNDKQEA